VAIPDHPGCTGVGPGQGDFAESLDPAHHRTVGAGVGHLFGAFQVGAFIDPLDFRRQVDDWVRTMRSTRPAAGTRGPIIPGDPNRWAEETRRVHGVPVVRAVLDPLRRVSKETGVPL